MNKTTGRLRVSDSLGRTGDMSGRITKGLTFSLSPEPF